MAKPTRLILFLIFTFSLSLQAQVYRCDGPNGPVYAQMPCAKNAERLADFDPVVELNQDKELAQEQEESAEAILSQPSAMEKFVATLYTQRHQQLGELDRTIAQMETRLDGQGDEELDEESRASIKAELSMLKSERDSVSEQYTSLISEAENRASIAEAED